MTRYRYNEIECDFDGCGESVTEREAKQAERTARKNGWAIGEHDYCPNHRLTRAQYIRVNGLLKRGISYDEAYRHIRYGTPITVTYSRTVANKRISVARSIA